MLVDVAHLSVAQQLYKGTLFVHTYLLGKCEGLILGKLEDSSSGNVCNCVKGEQALLATVVQVGGKLGREEERVVEFVIDLERLTGNLFILQRVK